MKITVPELVLVVLTGASGSAVIQPAVKCRGREYLRLIYGPEYTSPPNFHVSRFTLYAPANMLGYTAVVSKRRNTDQRSGPASRGANRRWP